jgi:hypothetical protein
MPGLGFLHAFYYQTLRNCQTPLKSPPDYTSSGSAETNVEKFLIHPDLARNAKVEWPDVDLDK